MGVGVGEPALGAESVERLGQLRDGLMVQHRAAALHHQPCHVPIGFAHHAYAAAGLVVSHGVVDQVLGHPRQQRLRARHVNGRQRVQLHPGDEVEVAAEDDLIIIERDHGRAAADETLTELRRTLSPDLPGTARMIEAARLKARAPIALADCFAAVTAAAHDATLLTGDPELIGLRDPPCAIVDLRL